MPPKALKNSSETRASACRAVTQLQPNGVKPTVELASRLSPTPAALHGPPSGRCVLLQVEPPAPDRKSSNAGSGRPSVLRCLRRRGAPGRIQTEHTDLTDPPFPRVTSVAPAGEAWFKDSGHIINSVNNRRHRCQAVVVSNTVGRSSLGGCAALPPIRG